MFTVYKVFCEDTDCLFYVGVTSNMKNRMRSHKCGLFKGKNIYFKFENFSEAVDATKREAALIFELQPPFNKLGKKKTVLQKMRKKDPYLENFESFFEYKAYPQITNHGYIICGELYKEIPLLNDVVKKHGLRKRVAA